jgi:hypothetical protein
MVNLWCSASDRVRVRRRTSTEAFQTCDAGRARVHLPSEAGTPDMTIGGADADRAGARPYLRRRPSGSVLLFLGLHTQNNTLAVSPFLERFLDSSVQGGRKGRILTLTLDIFWK